VAKALFEFVGRAATQEELFSCVSYIEQMMGTGGGWQDQIGGVLPGLKLIATTPGCEQTPLIDRVRLPPRVRRELESRMILHYVGERRLASNILHAIMGKYISGDPQTVFILAEIQRIARSMRRALDIGDVDRFGALMWDHWELNKQLDPDTTNARIEGVVDMVRPMSTGLKMVGAGGGGFMEIVAKDAARCRAIAAALSVIAQDTTAAVYRFEIDDAGLTVRTGGE
jgi:fucokinase